MIISKSAVLKARVKYGSWKNVARHFNIRKVTIRTIAKRFGIDTSALVKPRAEITIRKPEKPLPKLSYAARRRVKEKITYKKASRSFYSRLKEKTPDYAQGWYVLYEQEVCDSSPPCDPDSPNTRWELHTQKVSWFPRTPFLGNVKNDIVERNGFLWRTRNWEMVYCSYKGKIRKSKQSRK